MIKLLLLIISIYKINTFSIEITQYTVDKCGKICGEYRETSKEYEEICYKGCDYARNMTKCTKCNEEYQNKPASIYACIKGCQSYNRTVTRNENMDSDVKDHFDPPKILKNFFENFFGMFPSSIFPTRNTTMSGQMDDFKSLPDPLGIHEDDILQAGQGESKTYQQPQRGIFSHILFPNLFDNIMLRTSSVAKKGQGSVPSAQDNGNVNEVNEGPKLRFIIFPRFQVKPENSSPLDTDNANNDPFFKFFGNDNTPKEDSTIGDGGVNIKRANHDHVMEQAAPMNQPMMGEEDQGEESDNKNLGGMLMSDYDKAYVHHLGHPYASPSFVTGTQHTLKSFLGCLKNLRLPPWFLLVTGMLLITLVLWILISVLLHSKKSNKKMQKLYLSDSLDYILPYSDEKCMMENKELILEPALPVKMPVEKI